MKVKVEKHCKTDLKHREKSNLKIWAVALIRLILKTVDLGVALVCQRDTGTTGERDMCIKQTVFIADFSILEASQTWALNFSCLFWSLQTRSPVTSESLLRTGGESEGDQRVGRWRRLPANRRLRSCEFTFMYLYLCICVCIFVFVYLYFWYFCICVLMLYIWCKSWLPSSQSKSPKGYP